MVVGRRIHGRRQSRWSRSRRYRRFSRHHHGLLRIDGGKVGMLHREGVVDNPIVVAFVAVARGMMMMMIRRASTFGTGLTTTNTRSIVFARHCRHRRHGSDRRCCCGIITATTTHVGDGAFRRHRHLRDVVCRSWSSSRSRT